MTTEAVLEECCRAPQGAIPELNPDQFRQGMRSLSGAVSIITTNCSGERAGLTATAVCSVSASPPRLLVCVNRDVYANEMIIESGVYCVNVLASWQQDLAKRFAGMVKGVAGEERFLEGNWGVGKLGDLPILGGALVSFECEVVESIDSGSHTIFLGDVRAVNVAEAGDDPLMYFDANFRVLADC
jgi:flavin reductase (NADH)/flavin reductase